MNKLNKESVIGVSALLVHAANIDEIYTCQTTQRHNNINKDRLPKKKKP